MFRTKCCATGIVLTALSPLGCIWMICSVSLLAATAYCRSGDIERDEYGMGSFGSEETTGDFRFFALRGVASEARDPFLFGCLGVMVNRSLVIVF